MSKILLFIALVFGIECAIADELQVIDSSGFDRPSVQVQVEALVGGLSRFSFTTNMRRTLLYQNTKAWDYELPLFVKMLALDALEDVFCDRTASEPVTYASVDYPAISTFGRLMSPVTVFRNFEGDVAEVESKDWILSSTGVGSVDTPESEQFRAVRDITCTPKPDLTKISDVFEVSQ